MNKEQGERGRRKVGGCEGRRIQGEKGKIIIVGVETGFRRALNEKFSIS